MAQSSQSPWQSILQKVFITSLIFTVPIVIGRLLGGFQSLELAAYDKFLRQRPLEGIDDRVLVVTIDDNDIELLQQYPIHDGTLANLLDKLVSYEPRAIGLDLSRDIPHGLPGGRQRLTKVIRENPSIVTACLLSTATHDGSPPAPGTPDSNVAFADWPQDVDRLIRRAKLLSTPALSSKPSRLKHLCNDGKSENELPSLSFLLAQIYLEDLKIEPQLTNNEAKPTDEAKTTNDQGDIQLSQTVLKRINPFFGGYANAEVNDYQIMLNYRGGKQAFRQIPVTQILQNQADPRWFRDRVVLIGNTSEVSKDHLATPYINPETGSRDIDGVFVHAHAVSQILSAVLDGRPLIRSWPEVAEIFWIWGWALGTGLIALYTRRTLLFLVGVAAAGLALWGICYGLFLFQTLWVPYVSTLTALIFTAIGVRLVDLGDRSGYTQAIFEQLREQLLHAKERDRTGDYLEALVHRARAVRQGQKPDELLPAQAQEPANQPSDMEALYAKMAAQIRQELEAKQTMQQLNVAQTQGNSNKLNRMQSLLNRAQNSRSHPPHPVPTQDPPSEEPHD